MAVPNGYYDEGKYFYINVDDMRAEMVIFALGTPEQAGVISRAAAELLRVEAGVIGCCILRDKRDRLWVPVEASMPDLSKYDLEIMKRSTYYYRVYEKKCKKNHSHSSDCAKVFYPYVQEETKLLKK